MNESEGDLSESLLSSEKDSEVSSSKSTIIENLVVGKIYIPKGEFLSVIGRVGSGKTTFLHSILG